MRYSTPLSYVEGQMCIVKVTSRAINKTLKHPPSNFEDELIATRFLVHIGN